MLSSLYMRYRVRLASILVLDCCEHKRIQYKNNFYSFGIWVCIGGGQSYPICLDYLIFFLYLQNPLYVGFALHGELLKTLCFYFCFLLSPDLHLKSQKNVFFTSEHILRCASSLVLLDVFLKFFSFEPTSYHWLNMNE